MLTGIEDWRVYLADGEKYLETAVKAARKRPEVFTPEILYNLTAMAIEKFLMGFLMYHGDLADGHTMADLVQAVERHSGPQPDFADKLLFIDSFQEICNLDTYSRKVPGPVDIDIILGTGREVQQFVAGRLSTEYPV